ncbi:MAG: squalene/phytoene synthase family protein [Terracidiphilus sp.]
MLHSKEPFADLLIAFRQDQTVSRYETMDCVIDYCRYSANPVGRLVLYACGEVSPRREKNISSFPTQPARVCSSPISGRTSASTTSRAASIFLRKICAGSA